MSKVSVKKTLGGVLMSKKRVKGRTRGTKRRQPSITINELLERFQSGEALEIGAGAQKGNKKAQAIIAQYVWYLQFPSDPERSRLLRVCYESYKKSKEVSKEG